MEDSEFQFIDSYAFKEITLGNEKNNSQKEGMKWANELVKACEYSQQLVTQRKSVACGMYKAEVQNEK